MNRNNKVLSFFDFVTDEPLSESIAKKPKMKKKYKTVSKKPVDKTKAEVAEVPKPIQPKNEEYVRNIPESDLLVKPEEPKKVNETIFSEAFYVESPATKAPEPVRQYSDEYVRNLIKAAQEAKPKHEPEPELPDLQPINEGINYDESDEYKIIKDKDENFECKISVEGTTLNEAKARLVMDSEPWNLTFYGKIYPNGRCVIPLKKGLPLSEGSTGKMRLEVIAEDQLFVGWESDFVVEVSKKLSVEVKESKKPKVGSIK